MKRKETCVKAQDHNLEIRVPICKAWNQVNERETYITLFCVIPEDYCVAKNAVEENGYAAINKSEGITIKPLVDNSFFSLSTSRWKR